MFWGGNAPAQVGGERPGIIRERAGVDGKSR